MSVSPPFGGQSRHAAGRWPSASSEEQHQQEGDFFKEEDMSHENTADDRMQGLSGKDPKKARACQACRQMKIRCEPVDNQDYCKRCAKMNIQCLVSEPARKRQKTAHRVSQLEKKIDALTAALKTRQGQGEEDLGTQADDATQA